MNVTGREKRKDGAGWRGVSAAGVLVLLLITVLSAVGCTSPVAQLTDLIVNSIEETAEYRAMGYNGAISIHGIEEEELTVVDANNAVEQIVLENTGEENLVIYDMEVFLIEVEIDSETGEYTYVGVEKDEDTGEYLYTGITAEYSQNIFGIVSGTKPDLPVTIPAGSSLSSMYVYFHPDNCGPFAGILEMETSAGTKYFLLEGTGAWNLTLRVVDEAGDEDDGRIKEPIIVEKGETKIYHAITSEVKLVAETTDPLGLDELEGWIVESGSAFIDDPDTAEDESLLLVTSVTLSGHAQVRADFISPYLYVPNDYGTIDAALVAFDASAGDEGIVVAAGTYTLSATRNLVNGLVRGGYNAAFTTRLYETENDRNNVTYRTVLNTDTYQLTAGPGLTEAALLEGFVINESATVSSAIDSGSIKVQSGAELSIRYNTITGPVLGYGIEVYDSDPVISGNIITGGVKSYIDFVDDTSPDSAAIYLDNADPIITENEIYGAAAYLRSAGIYVHNSSKPEISYNYIYGGAATEEGGESYGIYVNQFSEPDIHDNPMIAAGSGDKTYGIHSINLSTPTLTNNIINGGTGTERSVAFYTAYAGWPVLDDNVLYLTGSASGTVGVWLGPNGRIERMNRNNLYGCDKYGYIFYGDGSTNISLNTIEQVNERWANENHADDNGDYLNVSEP